MNPETRRNFTVGFVFLAAIIALSVYSASKTDACPSDAEAIVTIVDLTDPLGDDARARLKDTIWAAIENASEHANIVLRVIIGNDQSGRQMAMKPVLLCRPLQPSRFGGFQGPTQPVKKRWQEFKDQICGAAPDRSRTANPDSPACGDPRRQGSFFEQRVEKSYTSPIAEQVIDGIRRHLPQEVKRWRLIVASDWREYNPPAFDVETRKCNRETDLKKLSGLLLVGEKEKLLVGNDDPVINNRVDSILILRTNMTQDEADCLENLADGFFRLNMASPPPTLTSTRLSVSGK
jgi:hypothetical protein